MNVSKSILVLVFVLGQFFSIGQDSLDLQPVESNNVSQESFEKLSSDIDYSDTKRALRPRNSKEDEKEKPKKKKERKSSNFQGLEIFQVLGYILIGILVLFLIYFIFSKIEPDKKFERSDSYLLEDEIEDINELDTVSLLDQALAKGDYRYAVRIQFLAILQSLSQKEKILWRKEKTNHEYARELRNENYGPEFQKLVTIFDYVWYGKREVSKEQYAQIDLKFKSFKSAMNEL